MPPEEQQETSMREDFEQSITAIENGDEGAITTETEADQQRAEAAEDLNNDGGEETPKAEAQEQGEADGEQATGKAAAAGEADNESASGADENEQDSGADDGKPEFKADRRPPASWTPAAREEWSKLPATVRAQISKREREIDLALDTGKEHRKTGEKFQGIADRYAQIIAAEGAPDALTGVEKLVQTVTTLRMGSAQQKVDKIANFIEHYGIDIGMLDDVLSSRMAGQPTGGGAPEGIDPNLAQYLDSRLAPVTSLLSRMDEDTRKSHYEANQKAIEEVAAFKQDHEFYADVQNDMADMVEMAEKRGIQMSLQDAYDKACALNPEISAILAERKANEALMNGQEELRKKQLAASSISGEQGGAVTPAELDMRGTIEQAWDAQVG